MRHIKIHYFASDRIGRSIHQGSSLMDRHSTLNLLTDGANGIAFA
jgi:hypothetical protein